MKLASLKAGGRDGTLIVVNRDLTQYVMAADVADTLSLLEPEQAALAFRLLPRDHAGDAFAELEHDRQEQLIEELGAQRIGHGTTLLDDPEVVDLVRERGLA